MRNTRSGSGGRRAGGTRRESGALRAGAETLSRVHDPPRITHHAIRVAGCRDVRPVVDVANRIGHRRRPVLRRVPSSGTRSGIAVQEGILPSLCGLTNGPVEYSPLCRHPVDRTCRDVPFLTGQKGTEKAAPTGTRSLRSRRRAARAAADGSAPRRAHESLARFALRPSAAQRRPRRRTARGPGKESAGEEESRQEVPLLSVRRRKEHRSGEDLYPRLAFTHDPSPTTHPP